MDGFPLLRQVLDASFTGPTLVGTVLLGVCGVYWTMLILGAVDLHLFDFHLDADAGHLDAGHLDAGHGDLGHGDFDHGHGHGGASSWGMTALKFLNINDVPLMIWTSLFAGSYWLASVLLDGSEAFNGDWTPIAVGVARSGALALAATKLLTEPLRGKFDTVEPNAAATLIGRRCVVTSSEVSPSFGQAQLNSEAAPLILHVRSRGASPLKKHDAATIVAYDAARAAFYVEPAVSAETAAETAGGEPATTPDHAPSESV